MTQEPGGEPQMSFDDYFRRLTLHPKPYDWQNSLASEGECANRLISIPTGFGKTLGILSVWLWHHVHCRNETWPRRLVWCLPMRVLVEQTEKEVREALVRMESFWEAGSSHKDKVGVHLLMGGADCGEWRLYPEEPSVLIGTQDMLLSRALNRGYASPRARWPMEFGLLNHDCLWVLDEVQLMDVGLATSAQLQAFRDDDASQERMLRPCYSWWMSATLQQEWLRKSPDTKRMAEGLSKTEIPAIKRVGHLWEDVSKPCSVKSVKDEKELASFVGKAHVEGGFGTSGLTLVVVNTVERACKIFAELNKDKSLEAVDIRLVHSRFRPVERGRWREEFLQRTACIPGTNRIVVATQVVEAGVDFSAGLLITEVAPWASLVQRFGRCARWGGAAKVIVADFQLKDDRAAAPYAKGELEASLEALERLSDVSPVWLEKFSEEGKDDLIRRLFPFEPSHLLLRHELDELFDTTPDLSGADIDISRFIRSGPERDLQVFWADVPRKTNPSDDIRPSREALCPVPFLKARDWLCGPETEKSKAPKLRDGMHAWVWDWLDGNWRRALWRDLYPGQTVMVAAICGGYGEKKGWTPDSREFVIPVALPASEAADQADGAQDDESLSRVSGWQTIAVHGREVGALARNIAGILTPSLASLFDLAGRWHDSGKSHPAFQGSIAGYDRPRRPDLAKAPNNAWLPVGKMYPMEGEPRRAGFRHELASTLALFAVLQRHALDHQALLGPWRELLEKAGMPAEPGSLPNDPPSVLEREIMALDPDQFDLLAYLICAHHGKIRLAWHSCPADQEAQDEVPRIRGIKDGDTLPPLVLSGQEGVFDHLPETWLDLAPAAAGLNSRTGAGWTERILELLDRHGPFVLAWLEAILRAADQRASHLTVADELLRKEVPV